MSVNNPDELKDRLINCPIGRPGWREFEEICKQICCYLFVPPLRNPSSQTRTIDGRNRRDIIFPNYNIHSDDLWGRLRLDYNARYIVIECKNYDTEDITQSEVIQLVTYLRNSPTLGNFGILLCSKSPSESAISQQQTEFRHLDNHLIIFMTKKELIEMIDLKSSEQNPETLIEAIIENFELSFIM